MATKEGLLAVGGDLRPERLLLAYRKGIFPWFSPEDPILWWSPNPRMVLYPEEFRISHSLKKTLRKPIFTVSMDTHFESVIRCCAQTRIDTGEGTWLIPDMINAYIDLHRMGYAHCIETWHRGELVGGLYGVALGRCFFGESMFSTMTDASKVALVQLVNHIKKLQFQFIDCQLPTEHLKSLGARSIPRSHFLKELKKGLKHRISPGYWN
jgi:leucyl/phenylalanyl-tRNA--protein transferase